jgi:hypothetical protein
VNSYQLAKLASSFVLPLAEAIEDPDIEAVLLADLGFVLPPDITLVGGMRAALEAIADIAIDLADFDPDAGDSSFDLLVRMAPAFRSGMSGIANLTQLLDPAARNSQLVTATDVLDVLPRRLLDYLTIDFTQREFPIAYALLHTVGVIALREVEQENDEHRVTFTERTVHWDRLGRAVTDPIALMKEQYGWDGATGIDTVSLFENLQELGSSLGLRSDFRAVDERARAAFDLALGGNGAVPSPESTKVLGVPLLPLTEATIGAEVYPVANASDVVDGFGIGVYADSQLATSIPLTDWLAAEIHLEAFATGFGVVFRKGQDAKLLTALFDANPATVLDNIALDASVAFVYAAPDDLPIVLLGSADGTRLEVASIKLVGGLSKPPAGALDVYSEIALPKLTLTVEAGEGDGFLQAVLGDGFTAAVDLTVGFSTRRGLYISGADGLEFSTSLALQVGPVFIDRITIKLESKDNDSVLTTSVSGGLALGPLVAVIEDIGLALRIDRSRPGVLGNADLSLGFKPPSGVGLAIDAGGFSGGGFLFFDPDKGEYAGGLELEFQGVISVKALGLITTRMPDGSKGFSLLIIITAEFPPIQLSFGFTLLGVGGLLGLNRTVVYDVLRGGVQDDSLESVLFPQNIVANASRIISDLRRIFPPLNDRFLIGPMGKLGWGTPTLINLELGLLLEIPRPAFAILGVLRVALPADDIAIVNLQVNFLGVIDFGKGQISFDASLYDSHILTFALTGDMAVRVYWSEDANFLLTVGGFHPAYVPPPMGLPQLRRLSIDIFPGAPRIHAESYFAVTSNTVQFGAMVELSAGADIFNVYGFMAYDVLIRLNPFHFVADFSAMLAVRSGSSTLFSVRVDATLEGPKPWHAHGTGSFEIGFIITITISVHFDVTFGDAQTTTLPPVQVMPKLTEALSNPGNWRAVLPQGTAQRVSMRALPPGSESLVLHPFGTLEVTQKVVPLDLAISLFGTQKPDHGTTFRVADVKLGTQSEEPTLVREQFAPAQFFAMSDAEKLSRKSFETYDAGVQVGGGNAINADYVVPLDVVYEVIYVPVRQARVLFRLAKLVFNALIRGAAVSKSSFAYARRAPSVLATPKVTVSGEKFGVASTRDLSLYGANMVFASEAEAHQALQVLTTEDPGRRRELQVIPLYEMEAS